MKRLVIFVLIAVMMISCVKETKTIIQPQEDPIETVDSALFKFNVNNYDGGHIVLRAYRTDGDIVMDNVWTGAPFDYTDSLYLFDGDSIYLSWRVYGVSAGTFSTGTMNIEYDGCEYNFTSQKLLEFSHRR